MRTRNQLRGRLGRTTATAAAAALLLTGCAGASPEKKPEGKKTVLTTFTVLEDMAENVAGDHLEVHSVTKPGAEIHDYEPTPGDVRKAAKADLVLDNGLGLERWFEKFVKDADAPHAVVSEGVEPMSITEDAYAGKPNPHAWMSPANGKKYVDNIVAAFARLDPEHAEDYRRNGEAYKKRLEEVRAGLVRTLSGLPRQKRALVTCEGAFSYLAQDAGLTEKYLWPVNAEQEGTPRQVAGVVDFVKKNKVPAVFCESTVSDKAMRQAAAAAGSRYAGTLYVDSLSAEGGPVPSYLALLQHDADVIARGLTGQGAAGAADNGTGSGAPAGGSGQRP